MNGKWQYAVRTLPEEVLLVQGQRVHRFGYKKAHRKSIPAVRFCKVKHAYL